MRTIETDTKRERILRRLGVAQRRRWSGILDVGQFWLSAWSELYDTLPSDVESLPRGVILDEPILVEQPDPEKVKAHEALTAQALADAQSAEQQAGKKWKAAGEYAAFYELCRTHPIILARARAFKKRRKRQQRAMEEAEEDGRPVATSPLVRGARRGC